MVRSVDHQICFRLAAAVPAASLLEPLRLGIRRPRRCRSCCRFSPAAKKEELIHEGLLRGLRGALPAPAPDRELRRALLRFYHGIAQADVGLHLASIAALDSAVCLILAALLEADRVLAQQPAANAIFRRIHRDEAGASPGRAAT
jgi:hypothetical protein